MTFHVWLSQVTLTPAEQKSSERTERRAMERFVRELDKEQARHEAR